MSTIKLRSVVWTTIAVAALLAGCQQNPPAEKSAAVEERNVNAGQAAQPGTGATSSGVTGTTAQGNPLRDPRSILSKRSVFFDFDSYAVKDDFKPLIDAHGKYLQGNRSAKMTIQGNCDERGSREYNIALGQRRADAVKRMMLLVGATDQQIETVSFGKEKPRNPGHDEGAWAENRRDDIVYAGE
ncbi:MAG TPA: peptidoglycan-associated lipoprotein Pal [Casimicrobiaceae bacterium]|jgi:peptidoglycan-associated lipoprotein|nr:peptidoglycan-associated lipoprotein Pal [Casimicrobiaceae bacterium]